MCYEIMVSVSGISCVLLHRCSIVRAGEVVRGCLSLVRRCRLALVVRAGLVDWTYLVIADMEEAAQFDRLLLYYRLAASDVFDVGVNVVSWWTRMVAVVVVCSFVYHSIALVPTFLMFPFV